MPCAMSRDALYACIQGLRLRDTRAIVNCFMVFITLTVVVHCSRELIAVPEIFVTKNKVVRPDLDRVKGFKIRRKTVKRS